MSEKAPATPALNPEQPEQAIDPNLHPEQGQLFDPTPLSPEQEKEARKYALIDAALMAADPAKVGDEPIKLNAPLSPEEEEVHKHVLEFIKDKDPLELAGKLPEELKPKRDWSDNEAQHKQKEVKHVEAIAKNLEGRLTASSDAKEVKAYREKVNTHNEKIEARNKEQSEREAEKQAYIDEQNAAAKAEAKERAAVRKEYISRQKLLRGEAQAKLYKKEIKAEADAKVEELLGPAKYGKPTEESKAALEAAAKEHVEAKLGEAKHAGYGVLNIDKLKAEDKAKAEAKEKAETPEVKNIYYKADKDGKVQLAHELTREGDGVDLNSLHGGEALLHTEDTTFYVNGKNIDDLVLNAKNLRDGGNRTDGVEFDDDEKMPLAIIGQSLNIDGSLYGGPIKKIEIKLNKIDEEDLAAAAEEWEARGDDPFEVARELKEKTDALEDKPDNQEEEDQPKGFRARVRSAMGKAADKLRNLHDKAMVKILTGSAHDLLYDEEKGKKRRRIAGGVLGAVALAAAVGGAYVASKSGVNVRPGGGNTAGNLAPLLPKPSLGNTIGDAIQHTGKSVEKAHQQAQQAAHAAAQAAQAHGTVMEIGPSTPTVSHMAVKELAAQGNLHPSLAEIQAKTAHELAINNITWPGARELADGTKVKIN